jgi:hypothetical protein
MKNTNSFLCSEKNAIIEDMQAVKVEIKVTKKSGKGYIRLAFFVLTFSRVIRYGFIS